MGDTLGIAMRNLQLTLQMLKQKAMTSQRIPEKKTPLPQISVCFPVQAYHLIPLHMEAVFHNPILSIIPLLPKEAKRSHVLKIKIF